MYFNVVIRKYGRLVGWIAVLLGCSAIIIAILGYKSGNDVYLVANGASELHAWNGVEFGKIISGVFMLIVGVVHLIAFQDVSKTRNSPN